MLPRSMLRNGWRWWHFPLAMALCAAGVALTWRAWVDIWQIANGDEESSHILLVPVVAVWMAWVRRARLRTVRQTGTIVGPLLVAAGLVLRLYGFDNAVQWLWHAGSALVVLGCLLTVLGTGVFFRLLPAFAVLVFLVPVPGQVREVVAMPLQTATAATTQVILHAIGASVDRSGNLLVINGQEVVVAEACNGLRMASALLLVSYAFAFGLPLRGWVRAVVLLASPLAATGCNVLRLAPTVLIYGYVPALAETFHKASGYLMLPGAFLLLLGIFALLKKTRIPVTRYTLAYQ